MSAWDGPSYDAVAMPQTAWGEEIVRRLVSELGGGRHASAAAVLDAGCGSGRVTATLLDGLPDATVVAGDPAESMRQQARVRLAPYGERVRVVDLDLEDDAMLGVNGGRPFDAVLSTGAFHWVRDHRAMYRRLAAVLRPGGALVAQCGGAGSVAEVREILDHLGVEWAHLNHYPSPDETAGWLRAAGFRDAWVWLTPEPVELGGREAAVEYLLAGVLAPYLAARRAAEQREIAEAVADRLAEPRIDFVRLNVLARRT
ncbi:class I SAM-dependent methyltransferase [Patulibacter americanus]|uniref:class I SAM-dependent methyltransferase n=1 Tax=Patulibacter americanus TaxID=588672 RepID=UPI0003B2FC3B|nr:class I SAM-dependent methyltransferase [Patulibacter americanus]